MDFLIRLSRLYLGLIYGFGDWRESSSEFRSVVVFHLENEILGLGVALLGGVVHQVLGLGLAMVHLGRIGFCLGLVSRQIGLGSRLLILRFDLFNWVFLINEKIL